MTTKRIWLLTLAVFILSSGIGLYAQTSPNKDYKILNPESIVSKNFYFLHLLEVDSNAKALIESDPVLSKFAKTKYDGISKSDNIIDVYTSYQFTDDEIKQVGDRLANLYTGSNALGKVLENHIYPSGSYIIYKDLSEKDFLRAIWEQDAKGINRFVDVYGKGVKPRYAKMDSIDFRLDDKYYQTLSLECRQYIYDACKDKKSFFSVPLTTVLTLSDINDRYESAEYEPMGETINKVAYAAIKQTDFSKYPYSVILSLGDGPDQTDVRLSPRNKIRLRTAALKYFTSAAPFIIVSGGRAHPYKTIYNEAWEMKKFLMEQCNIPEKAIIMEPHARHTTTNIRNASRIMIREGVPMDKIALITSTPSHVNWFSMDDGRAERFVNKCKDEMGIVPLKLGKRIDESFVEFYPQIESLYINPIDPLDP